MADWAGVIRCVNKPMVSVSGTVTPRSYAPGEGGATVEYVLDAGGRAWDSCMPAQKHPDPVVSGFRTRMGLLQGQVLGGFSQMNGLRSSAERTTVRKSGRSREIEGLASPWELSVPGVPPGKDRSPQETMLRGDRHQRISKPLTDQQQGQPEPVQPASRQEPQEPQEPQERRPGPRALQRVFPQRALLLEPGRLQRASQPWGQQERRVSQPEQPVFQQEPQEPQALLQVSVRTRSGRRRRRRLQTRDSVS